MKNIYFLVILFIFSVNCARTQENISIAFYNVENLFDTLFTAYSDTAMSDDPEFQPAGKKEWTQDKLNKKMSDLSKIIRLINNGDGPDVMGFAESENMQVFSEMVNKFLSDRNYHIVYYESNDRRGIDVALIFKKDLFELLESKPIKIKDIPNTRDILFAALKHNDDTLYFYVNHWPSRRGGEDVTAHLREKAAETLKQDINRLISTNQLSKIIIMGDFNDMPDNKSIKEILNALPLEKCDLESKDFSLFNTSYKKFSSGEGTYFYQGNFNMLDQIIISSGLLLDGNLKYKCDSFGIFKNELNTTLSGKYKGAPFPTYAGNRYLGGFSDHFPVYIYLEKK